ncbi:type I secretion system permease/ATPase [Novosphingobium ginsenosidimutans]|uniref:type I secretion system permease/ATPase n=1 Tax=Novosphingobium ginsenosidimutans TaxID=1176536 RepID=UPI0013757356|nr:type I secretion system permease/ATPase [Novosphingobium ginsenosidimutans]
MALWTGELGAALKRYRATLITVAVLSAVLNVLVLAGSFYLMMIYDSVLPSHSLPTLVGLFTLVTIAYSFQGLFEHGRGKLLASVGAQLERQLSRRVQRAMNDMARLNGKTEGDGLAPMRDLDQVRTFLTGTGPATLLDLPWIGFFLIVLGLLHYWLGLFALAGAIVLIALAVATHRVGAEPSRELGQLIAERSGQAETALRHSEVLTVLGMRGAMERRWDQVNQRYLIAQDRLSAAAGKLGSFSKVFRLFLQSAILSVGALLVIDGKASGGVIFASSLLFGRALAPIDMAIGNWRSFTSTKASWARLNQLLDEVPALASSNIALPLPQNELRLEGVQAAPPGHPMPAVSNVGFAVAAGSVVGVIGPSGAGKSSLARTIVGAWAPRRGSVRLDGATIDQWPAERLGQAIGYLPQSVELFDGTIAENISRFAISTDSDAVIEAAKLAGVHDMIVRMPLGYETPIGRDGSWLSAGQRQRIGLARALYGSPFLLVLDEPNSNLDQEGEVALETAIAAARDRGCIVIVVAHRPAILAQATHIVLLRNGRMEGFGPRDEVLAPLLRQGDGRKLPAAA